MEIDPSLKVALVSMATTVLTLLIAKFISSRLEKAQSKAQESDAAESLSNAAKTQIEVYQKEIIDPLKKRIAELAAQIAQVEEERRQEQVRSQTKLDEMGKQIVALTIQVDEMKREISRADASLEYLSSVARQTYPNEVSKAIRIRRGQE